MCRWVVLTAVFAPPPPTYMGMSPFTVIHDPPSGVVTVPVPVEGTVRATAHEHDATEGE
jgi:hypothetical protein